MSKYIPCNNIQTVTNHGDYHSTSDSKKKRINIGFETEIISFYFIKKTIRLNLHFNKRKNISIMADWKQNDILYKRSFNL